MPRAPEQQARERIDLQLQDCGWIVQDYRKADFSAGRGIALREVRLKSGPCDDLQERYDQWLKRKDESRIVFTSEQRAWLGLIRDHIATSLNIEGDDFDQVPFIQRRGLGNAHHLIGAELPRLLEELNEALAA